jgi:acyl carrier protein
MTTQTQERTELVTVVIEALSAVLNQELPDATEETKLFDNLGMDSTGVLGLLMELEDRLGIEVDPDELEQKHLESVGSLTDYVELCR